MNIIFKDLGLIDYKEAWDYQENLFAELISLKLQKQNYSENSPHKHNYLLFCEHPHVYTLGNSGKQSNLLISDDLLHQIGAKFYKINRGGDITYHGPGQIVGYPILDLETIQLGIKDYIYLLEESVINTLFEYGIKSTRLSGATGVWLDINSANARKICAIGVRASRYITMHGFAFNVNTNLDYFRYINPCGFIDKGVTSMEKELEAKQNIEEIKNRLLENIKKWLYNVLCG
jgi:lipoyl(octanoyl) transferase